RFYHPITTFDAFISMKREITTPGNLTLVQKWEAFNAVDFEIIFSGKDACITTEVKALCADQHVGDPDHEATPRRDCESLGSQTKSEYYPLITQCLAEGWDAYSCAESFLYRH